MNTNIGRLIKKKKKVDLDFNYLFQINMELSLDHGKLTFTFWGFN